MTPRKKKKSYLTALFILSLQEKWNKDKQTEKGWGEKGKAVKQKR